MLNTGWSIAPHRNSRSITGYKLAIGYASLIGDFSLYRGCMSPEASVYKLMNSYA